MGEANSCCNHGCRQCGGDRSVGKESAEGKRREGVYMEVFGGDTVSKRRVASGDGFMGRRRYAKRVRLLSERVSGNNRFDFVNEVAAEAIEYVENNRDEYGGKKKAILHVLSNRMNDAGYSRPVAYEESDPFLPGPTFLRQELE